MRRAAAVAALAALVTAVPAAATPAAYPARNGQLTFASNTADNVTQQLFKVLPDGSDRHAVTRTPGSHYLPSWSPDGERVAFVYQGAHENSIGVVKADGTGEHTIAPNETSPPIWSPDGRELAYGRLDPASPTVPEIWVVKPDGTGATRIGAGSWPSWSPDGTMLAAVSGDGRSIVVYERTTGVSRTIAVAAPDHSAAWPQWSPLGTEIAYTETDVGGAVNENATIHLADPSGGGQRRLIGGTYAAWAPDGRALAVDSSKLLIVGLDGIVAGEASDSAFGWPSWSPDGRFLAYATVGTVATPSAVFVVRRDGTDRRQLTHETPRSETFYPVWSPDGKRILFASIRAVSDADLYSVPGEQDRIDAVTLDDDVDQVEPAWSPDGARLAYVERVPTYVPVGSQTVRVVVDGQHVGREGDESPSWSPDSSRLAFVREDAVWIERVDGSRRRRIARGLQPAWSPDGRSIAFATQTGALALADVASGRSRLIVTTQRLKDFLGAAQAGAARSPTWSPDGRSIGFIGIAANWHSSAVVSVVLTTPDGRGLSTLTSGVGAGLAWSPDGTTLASTADDHIVLVDPETGVKTEVAPELAGWSADPAWRPVCGLTGTTGKDVLRGSAGADVVCGLEGNDRISGGRGRDHLFGEAGDDVITANDGTADVIGCGPGRDTVVADRRDLVGLDCERIRRLP